MRAPMAAKKKTPSKKKTTPRRKSAPKKKSVRRAGTSKRPSPIRKRTQRRPARAQARPPLQDAPEALALARFIAEVATQKKAGDVLIVDVRTRASAVGYDYLVLASGESDRQLAAIQEGVDELLKPQGKRAAMVETSADWLCVTYDEGVVAHFFTPDRRGLLDLEGLWADAPRVRI